jgi:hypothetical protein
LISVLGRQMDLAQDFSDQRSQWETLSALKFKRSRELQAHRCVRGSMKRWMIRQWRLKNHPCMFLLSAPWSAKTHKVTSPQSCRKPASSQPSSQVRRAMLAACLAAKLSQEKILNREGTCHRSSAHLSCRWINPLLRPRLWSKQPNRD